MSETGKIIRGAGGYLKRNTDLGVGIGHPHGGEEGDIRVQMVDGSPKLFAKAGGVWYGVSLKDETVEELKIGNSSNYIELDPNVGINVVNNSTDVASLGQTLRVGRDSTGASALRVESDGSMSIGVKDGTPQFAVAADGSITFGGELSTAVDLSGLTEAAVAAADYFVFFDGGATGATRKDSIADLATLFAGAGLTATSSVIAVDADQSSQITQVGTLTSLTLSGNIIMGDDTSIGIADDAERIEFDGAGDISLLGCNVGIGTATPAEALHVSGNVDDDDIAIKITNLSDDDSASTPPKAALLLTAASNNAHFRLYGAPDDAASGHQVDLGSTAGGSFLTFSPANSEAMRITAAGNTLPGSNIVSTLGSNAKKWLTLHAAELRVDTLVAADVLSTIGGRILVGPTTELIEDITNNATTIKVKHNNLADADILFLEKGGNFEAIEVDSGPTTITGGFSYTVVRDIVQADDTGSVWVAGDAVFNTGTTSDGFIDMYSTNAVNVAANLGPTIVGNIRTGTAYNNYEPMWAIGNLRGLYGKANDTSLPGVGIGQWSAGSLVATASDIQFYNAGTSIAKWDGATITLGSAGEARTVITNTAISMYSGQATPRVRTAIDGDGKIALGGSSGADVTTSTTDDCIRMAPGAGVSIFEDSTHFTTVTSSGMAVHVGDASNASAVFGATTYIGLQASEHIKLTGSSFEMKDGAVVMMSLSDGDINMKGKINITSVSSQNVVIGLNGNDLGSDNVVIGFDAGIALDADSTQNVILGAEAGKQVESGVANVLIGHQAGENIADSSQNIAIGRNALQDAGKTEPTLAAGDTANQYNVAVGYAALADVDATAQSEGFGNCGFGSNAGDAITTGNFNICIGYGADVAAVDSVGAIVIGTAQDGVMSGVADRFTFGKNAGKIYSSDFDTALVSWSQTSDIRRKQDIKDDILGLDFINKLRNVTFRWKPQNEFPEEWDDYSEVNALNTDKVHHGLIAQEVKQALDECDIETFKMWEEGEDGKQCLATGKVILPLIKAVQELSAKVTALEAQN